VSKTSKQFGFISRSGKLIKCKQIWSIIAYRHATYAELLLLIVMPLLLNFGHNQNTITESSMSNLFFSNAKQTFGQTRKFLNPSISASF